MRTGPPQYYLRRAKEIDPGSGEGGLAVSEAGCEQWSYDWDDRLLGSNPACRVLTHESPGKFTRFRLESLLEFSEGAFRSRISGCEVLAPH